MVYEGRRSCRPGEWGETAQAADRGRYASPPVGPVPAARTSSSWYFSTASLGPPARPGTSVFEQVQAMVAWARSGQALGLEHDELEERVRADGHEVMRRLTEGHLALRAVREQRRGDVTDAEGICG